MARIARVIAPGLPHHVTQRGNRRQQTFFSDDDYQAYLELLAEWCGKKTRHGGQVLKYKILRKGVGKVTFQDLTPMSCFKT
ncbi:hypothetical protein [Geotalea uraniireducens]|uniref:hypothetical protein n=1 Tax=Geotalea uraniireducens TaxID=351604 RepID=UPI0024906186|nr:hypothetical protein [Geotalea uraniireducens]